MYNRKLVILDSSPRNEVSCCSFFSFFHYFVLLLTVLVFKYSFKKFFKNIVNSFFFMWATSFGKEFKLALNLLI